ncbi:uncharacterized protein LOC143201786 [Rhynchophorus ferrugineus]|uniref:Uncharacterized protein n=1 Tax=Rhynchophorus ferrugineus TaxID=354439 RepID=A0A834M1P2_RHYFE|nr:hypothetical protein GWI33_019176 [Rhynchophorus ferrugineus]
MNSLGFAIFLVLVATARAGYAGGAVIAGPGGAVIRTGVAPGIVAPGLGHAGAAAVIAPAVSAGYVAAGPAIPGILAGGLYGPGLYGAGLLGPGSGLEGQYIPDYTEHLYDDGSYKPYLYGH